MALAKPDPSSYLSQAHDEAEVHALAGGEASRVYSVKGIYAQLVFDDWGIEEEHGDYNAEWLGRKLAEQLAIERYRDDVDGVADDEVKTVTYQDCSSLSELHLSDRQRHDNVVYEVAVVPA